MSKAYLLVICLLAASFTGCLGSDDTEEEIPVEEEEETEQEELIVPVGTGDNGGNETNNYYYNNETNYNNETYFVNATDYFELVSHVENLTTEVKALRLAIEEMQSSKYDVAENSTMIIYHVVENVSGQSSGGERHVEPLYGITKEGNTITVEYLGVSKGNVEANSPANCTSHGPGLTFYGHDDNVITSITTGSIDALSFGLNENVEVFMECEHTGSNNQPYDYWSSMIITLPEEPVGVSHQYYHSFD